MNDLIVKLRNWNTVAGATAQMCLQAADEIEALLDQVAVLKAENEDLREKYDDLIYQVATKFPSETRHETAKRYIRECEDRPALEGADA